MCGIEGRHVRTSKGSKADNSTAPTSYAHALVGVMIDVRFDASWEEQRFERVPDAMPDGYSAAETCVLTHTTEATNHFSKDLSFIKKPSPPRGTGSPRTFHNAPQFGTSVNVTLELYPSDVLVIHRLTKEEITENVVCTFFTSPVAAVMGRPAKSIVWLEIKPIGQDEVRVKSTMSVNVIGMPLFNDSTAKVQQLTASTRSFANRGTISSGERYTVYRVD